MEAVLGRKLTHLSASLFFLLQKPHRRLFGTSSEPLLRPFSLSSFDNLIGSETVADTRLYVTHHGSRVAYPGHSADLPHHCPRFFDSPTEDPLAASLSQRGQMVVH